MTPSTQVTRAETLLRWSVFCILLLGFILIPFFLLEGKMSALVQETFRSGMSISVITLAVIGFLLLDIALPVPSSFVLSGTGYLLGLAAGTAVGFIGLSCATCAGYALGRYAGGPLAQRIVGRVQLERFANLITGYGDAVLVGFRAVPVLAEATAILAGISKLPFSRFLFLTSIGNFIVALLYAWVGAHSADQSSFLFAAVASIVLPIIIVLTVRRAAHA